MGCTLRRLIAAISLRSARPLEAALFPPQTGYYTDLIEETAALWKSLSQNHPSLDGNKRTACAVVYTFLVINGARLIASATQAEKFILTLYDTGTVNFEQLRQWLNSTAELD